jgi:hypothetical protein
MKQSFGGVAPVNSLGYPQPGGFRPLNAVSPPGAAPGAWTTSQRGPKKIDVTDLTTPRPNGSPDAFASLDKAWKA